MMDDYWTCDNFILYLIVISLCHIPETNIISNANYTSIDSGKNKAESSITASRNFAPLLHFKSSHGIYFSMASGDEARGYVRSSSGETWYFPDLPSILMLFSSVFPFLEKYFNVIYRSNKPNNINTMLYTFLLEF